MFNEYDVVFANKDLSKSVLKGRVGTVLNVLDKSNEMYAVEFVGESVYDSEVLFVSGEDIDILNKGKECKTNGRLPSGSFGITSPQWEARLVHN